LDTSNIYTLFSNLSQDNLSFVYGGEFNDDITEWVIDISNQNIESVESLSKMQRRVSFLMVECLQNVVRHGKEHSGHQHLYWPNLFMTRNVGDVYYITSANLVKNSSVEQLREQLENINQMDEAQLKRLYRAALETGELSNKGGGGLGLIEMARKSGHKIDFDFEKWDDNFTHFFFRLKLAAKGVIIPEEQEGVSGLNIPRKLLHEMDNHKILMLFQGDFSKGFLIPIIHVMENHMRNSSSNKAYRRVIMILIELLQNIGKHGTPNDKGNVPGIFILAEHKEKYALYFGNYTTHEKASKVDAILEEMSLMSSDEQNAYFRTRLKVGTLEEDGGGAGLGLIDSYRHADGPIQKHQYNIDSETVFIGLRVFV